MFLETFEFLVCVTEKKHIKRTYSTQTYTHKVTETVLWITLHMHPFGVLKVCGDYYD